MSEAEIPTIVRAADVLRQKAETEVKGGGQRQHSDSSREVWLSAIADHETVAKILQARSRGEDDTADEIATHWIGKVLEAISR